jgi:scyllo-inositol 2-dehydrogenase (NADP+)
MMARPLILNVALIGYGYAGKTLHAPLIDSVAGLKLVAVCSSNSEKVSGDRPSVQVSKSAEELYAQPNIDVVVIATPNSTHFDLARRALLAGKHVVVDKPFTVTSAHARELKKIAEQQNRVLSVFQNRRWDADFLTLRAIMTSGKLGEIVSFVSRFDRYRPEVKIRWREQAGEGNGLWYDLGPHLLDQALQLFGRPIAIQANFEMQRNHAQAVDYFDVRVRYEHLLVTLHAGMLVQEERPRYELKGRAGSYIKFGLDTQEDALKRGELPVDVSWGHDPRDGVLQMLTTGGSISTVVPTLRGDYRQFYIKFRDAVLLNTANPVSLDDAVLTVELIELACESAKSGCEKIVPTH